MSPTPGMLPVARTRGDLVALTGREAPAGTYAEPDNDSTRNRRK
jgi:hypothetical protein